MRPPIVLSSLLLVGVASAQDRGEAIAGELARQCQPLIGAEVAVGIAAGAIDGDLTVVRGFGRVDAASDGAPDGRTVWEIGSISKVFTGLLFADAIERGLVAFDDPVQKHLPADVKMPRVDDKEVLLWQLTTHTSGLPRLPYGESPDQANPYAHLDAAHLYAALGEILLRNEPGKVYEYSNLGAGLLGHVLVLKTGAHSYGEVLAQRIAGPLQLADTTVALGDGARQRLALPYDSEGDPAHNWDLAELAGAGGIRSTVDDLLRFARFQLHPDGPLAAAILRSQQKLHTAPGGMGVAYGWHLSPDGKTLWHNGETGGYHGYLAVQPESRRAVCLLCNTARGDIDEVGVRILRWLAGESVEPLRLEVAKPIARAELEPLVGTYRQSDGIAMEVTLRPRGLYAQLGPQPPFRLFARGPREFFFRVTVASVTFEPATGMPMALVLHQDGHDIRFGRTGAGQVK